jgi:hypothetical protein
MSPPGKGAMYRYRMIISGLILLTAVTVGGAGGRPGIPSVKLDDITIRMLFTGNTLGYIDPCDCSRGRLGGLDRRAAAIAEYQGDDLPTVLIDLGNLFELPGRQRTTELGRRQAGFLVSEMSRMGYRLQALGSQDLVMPPELMTAHLPSLTYPPLLTNRAPGAALGFDTVPSVRMELGGLIVDFFNVVDPEMVPRAGILLPWGTTLDEALVRSAAGEGGRTPADLQVVIAHVPFSQVDRIPGRFPEADVVLDGALLLPRQAQRIERGVVMSTSGKGQHLGVLDLRIWPRAEQRAGRDAVLGFQGLNVDLPMEYPADPQVRARMEAFRQQLIRDGLILP